MASAEEARRLYAQATRLSPVSWVFILGVFVLILAEAYEEGSGPFFWLRVALLVGLLAFVFGSLIHRSLRMRRASPEELSKRTVEALRSSAASATVFLVCGLIIAAGTALVVLIDWLQDDFSWGDMGSHLMGVLITISFLHTYFVELPRRRRILESLPPGTEQAPSPAA